jgi:hypothetical protein
MLDWHLADGRPPGTRAGFQRSCGGAAAASERSSMLPIYVLVAVQPHAQWACTLLDGLPSRRIDTPPLPLSTLEREPKRALVCVCRWRGVNMVAHASVFQDKKDLLPWTARGHKARRAAETRSSGCISGLLDVFARTAYIPTQGGGETGIKLVE